jgi:hypothetical protein
MLQCFAELNPEDFFGEIKPLPFPHSTMSLQYWKSAFQNVLL